MKKINRLMVTMMAVMLLVMCLPAFAGMEGAAEIPHGQEDLTKLTFEELQNLFTDILKARDTYHTPSDAQKTGVLSATQASAEQYFSDKGLKVTGWAWYDSEYTYTKNWDVYSLKTHLDYKDSDDRSKHATIYSEVYYQDGSYKVAYLKADDAVVMDTRSDFGDAVWFEHPSALINEPTGIDLSTYTVGELDSLSDSIVKEVEANHSVSKNVSSIILTVTKSSLEQYCLKNNIEIKSYAWYDSEYTYLRDWDYYWLETHVDYTKGSSSQKTDKLFSEICFIDGNYDLVFLKLGSTVITDKRDTLVTSYENGIPHYSWSGAEPSNKEQDSATQEAPEATPQVVYVTPEPGAEVTPQVIYITPEPQAELTPQVVYITPEPQPELTPEIIYVTPEPAESNGIFNINLSDASDDQLIEAADAIKAEQRSRIKTHIILEPASLEIAAGKTQKIEAIVVDLPEGEKAPKVEWTTSDKAIATCNNGQVKAAAGGNAVITCSATLADGTYIYAECSVKVNIPISSITPDKKNLNMSAGEKFKSSFAFKPDDASNKRLTFESSNADVAAVASDGTIEAVGEGNATITAKAVDGSGKSVSISVKVVDNRIGENEIARLLMFATCNDVAEDIFTADGNHFDKKKLHDYRYFDNVLEVVDRGTWTTKDGGNNWHVQDVIVQHRIYGGYNKYTFDIHFDGKNYIMSNGWVVRAAKKYWLDKSDPSKYGEDDLSNLDFYIYLTVSPKQIGY